MANVFPMQKRCPRPKGKYTSRFGLQVIKYSVTRSDITSSLIFNQGITEQKYINPYTGLEVHNLCIALLTLTCLQQNGWDQTSLGLQNFLAFYSLRTKTPIQVETVLGEVCLRII